MMIVASRSVLSAAALLAVLAGPWIGLTPPAVAAPKTVAIAVPCCAGMTLVQNRAPKDDAPDADDDQTPDEGQQPSAQPPSNDEDNANPDPDVRQPPDTAEPPGCIFNKGPLDLIV
jgi:hypothetical protein